MKMVIYSVLTFAGFLLFGSKAFCAPEAQGPKPASVEYQTCMFESGDVGKLKFRGNSREEAFERTSRACLQARVQGYIKMRGDIPSVERKILFAEDCVNKTYCKH